jgi:hypothetical protein
MAVDTQVSKGRSGFQAESFIELDQFGVQGKTLQVSTFKSGSGKLLTVVGAVKIENGGISFVMYGDYRKTVAATAVRCTEKAVRTQQEQVLAVIPQYIQEAVAFYNKELEAA